MLDMFSSLQSWVRSITYDVLTLPALVKQLSFSLFLFMLWRGLWADVFFSIYITTIVTTTTLVGVLGAVLSACKLLLSVPVGRFYDTINPKLLLIFSKVTYILGGLCYFSAGYFSSPRLLLVGIVCNGIASPVYFTTVYNIVRHQTNHDQATRAFGLVNSAIHAWYFIGALCIAIFINHLPLPYVFLLMIIFTLISLFVNLRFVIHHEKGVWAVINKTILHDHIYHRLWKDLKQYNITLYLTLFLQLLFGILDYVSFLFIPLLGLSNNLPLSHIAIIFAIMRIPYLFSFFFSEWFSRSNKFVLVCGSYIMVWLLLLWLSQVHHFAAMLWLSLLVATWLSLTRPIILWFISQLVQARHRSEITGLQEAVSRVGEIIGALGFALVAEFGSLQLWFLWVGLVVLLAATGILMQQHLFILPKVKRLTVVKNTVLGIVEDFESYWGK